MYGDWFDGYHRSQDKKKVEVKNPTKLRNDVYAKSLNAYLMCTTLYLEDFEIPELLEKQLNRLDIDTVCGFELYQMKQVFLNTDVLEYKKFQPNL